MRKAISIMLWVSVILSMTLSCMSNSASLKTTTAKLNKLVEAMSETKYEVEFNRLLSEYNELMNNLPNSIQALSNEDIINLDGGNDYLAALERFNQVYMAKSLSQNEPISSNETTEINDAEVGDNYILIPGVTYTTTSSARETDEFGGNVSLGMEFTIYNDGSATGKIIETNSKASYGNNNSYEHTVEGSWEEVSKHDKRFLKIDLVLETEDTYKRFTYYVDEDLNAYANDVNTRPVKLKRKDRQDEVLDSNTLSLIKQKNKGREDAKNAIDLGLPSGLKWASCNVGASEPEECGDYFAWGEIEPYYITLVLSPIEDSRSLSVDPSSWKDGKSDGHEWSSYKWCEGGDYDKMTKYVNKSSEGSVVDNKTTLELADDVARVNWGSSWRMPTDEEWTELRTECTWTWTNQNGVNGFKVLSSNGNSIFLPAAGHIAGDDISEPGSIGDYWSSSVSSMGFAWSMTYYYMEGRNVVPNRVARFRSWGLSVRPVTE